MDCLVIGLWILFLDRVIIGWALVWSVAGGGRDDGGLARTGAVVMGSGAAVTVAGSGVGRFGPDVLVVASIGTVEEVGCMVGGLGATLHGTVVLAKSGGI